MKRSKFDQIAKLKDAQFRRLTGVSRRVFDHMLEILTTADAAKRARGGPETKLTVADQLLMSLEYLREYRTYFHIGQSYGVSESNAYKICRWVEDTLIVHPSLALPGKKALLKSDASFEVILIDAAESPIQRPKKDNGSTTQARRNAIPSKAR